MPKTKLKSQINQNKSQASNNANKPTNKESKYFKPLTKYQIINQQININTNRNNQTKVTNND